MQTGWIQVGELWYYLDETGVCTNLRKHGWSQCRSRQPCTCSASQTAPAQTAPAPAQTAPPDAAIAAVLKPRAGRCMRPLMRHCCRMALPPG
ncbi:MAG: hypothetical protein ACLVLH_10430 [Eisenbergiella massiliensis]